MIVVGRNIVKDLHQIDYVFLFLTLAFILNCIFLGAFLHLLYDGTLGSCTSVASSSTSW